MWRMATKLILSALVLGISATASVVSAAPFVIAGSPGVFTPSFRGAANTTYFGWGSGSFDASVDNELIDNPPTTVGGAAGAALNQVGTTDVLSSSNNIYASSGNLSLEITTPTLGTPGTGFTTLIVQGRTAFGGFPGGANNPVLGAINGVLPTTVIGTNGANAGQVWSKYELSGNQASYVIPLTGGANVSLNTLIVDAQWSSVGFAADSAIAPEPATISALGAAGCALLGRRRRAAR